MGNEKRCLNPSIPASSFLVILNRSGYRKIPPLYAFFNAARASSKQTSHYGYRYQYHLHASRIIDLVVCYYLFLKFKGKGGLFVQAKVGLEIIIVFHFFWLRYEMMTQTSIAEIPQASIVAAEGQGTITATKVATRKSSIMKMPGFFILVNSPIP